MSAPTSSAPLVVNTRDGACWTRHTVTEGGIALYALADVCKCPEFVMATLAELAERGIVGSADVLPVPVGPQMPDFPPQPRTELEKLHAERARLQDLLAEAVAEKHRACRERDEMRERVSEPYGCQHCGIAKRSHGRRWITGVGYHAWTAPTQEQIAERMKTRRTVRLASRVKTLARLRDRVDEVERAYTFDTAELKRRIAELEAERHSTNESLSEAAEQLRADRDRIAELEALAAAATEYRVWEPGYGLYVRRSPGASGFAILEARRTEHGRRAWTKAGLRYTVALPDAELFCWPDAESAVAEARRVMPGAVVREGEPAETGGAR